MTDLDFTLINRPVIVLENNGVLWNLATTPENNLICRYSINGGKKWSTEEELLSNFSGEFDLTFDPENNLHLAAIDNQGKMFYINWKWVEWDKRNIPVTGLAKSVTIAMHNKNVDLIYLTFSNNVGHQWQQMHLRITETEQPTEFTIATGKGHFLNKGTATYDNRGNLHFVYRYYDKLGYQLFYSKLILFDSGWQPPGSLGIITDNSPPCLLADDDGNMHLICTITDGINLRAAYLKKYPAKGWLMPEWTAPIYLSPERCNAYTPTMVIRDNQIIALWQQIDGIFRCTSLNSGRDWGKVYKDYIFEDVLSLTPYKQNSEPNIKISSFGTTTSDLVLIAASHFSKEEFFSPTPKELGNHYIFPLNEKLAYLPKGMQLFDRLLNYHLQNQIMEIIKYRNTTKEIKPDENTKTKIEPTTHNEIIRALNERIDKLLIHTKTLTNKLNLYYKEIKSKDVQIEQLKAALIQQQNRDLYRREIEIINTEKAEVNNTIKHEPAEEPKETETAKIIPILNKTKETEPAKTIPILDETKETKPTKTIPLENEINDVPEIDSTPINLPNQKAAIIPLVPKGKRKTSACKIFINFNN